MGTLNDLSQLKHFKAAESAPAAPPAPTPSEDWALAGASSSADYFSALLGTGTKTKTGTVPARPHRTTVVTPNTVARIREEQAEEARTAERAAFAAREAELQDALELQKAACATLADELAALQTKVTALETGKSALEGERQTLLDERQALQADLEKERAQPRVDPARERKVAEQTREIERLQALLAEAQRTSLSSSVLLDKPAGFAEKFTGELREHVIETLIAATDAAEAAGRDRRARILEAVLGANPPSGELDRRREEIRQILKDAGSKIDNAALAALGKLGFRVISGKNHHKLEWAGIRFPLAKTPSDCRTCLNSAAEITNRIL